MLTVKKVAQQLQISEYTVRYYTNLGLVPNVKRNAQNERIFDESSLEWLRGCKMLRSTGMSIKQIKRYVDLCKVGIESVDERYAIMKNEQQRAIQRLKDAEQNLQFVNAKVNVYEQAIHNHENVDPLNPQNND
ncbi:MerR family transcriptional regulator [Lactobacillus sp. Sy-1]|uniref:MerR family transcriptional regulator n=1 Tax=Lactobacillus sp. Sy-1 TaxID=2109645 RepID=UPI001C5B16B0|nr:MerR family transcriptional regulator [Lactobacillus sp. Sy-1]MBW1606066.1 MerR family transcriptional regulator [Lactobacillus sp. Sy-1]